MCSYENFLIWISWVLYLICKERFELMSHDDMDFLSEIIFVYS